MDSYISVIRKKLVGAKKVVILGVGNELKKDDRAGIIVVKEINNLQKKYKIPNLVTFNVGTTPENFTKKVCEINPSHIIFVDAVEADKKPGTIDCIPIKRIQYINFSTHSVPLSLTVDYFEMSLNCEILVIGIQPKHTSFGKQISREVMESCRCLAKSIIDALM